MTAWEYAQQVAIGIGFDVHVHFLCSEDAPTQIRVSRGSQVRHVPVGSMSPSDNATPDCRQMLFREINSAVVGMREDGLRELQRLGQEFDRS